MFGSIFAPCEGATVVWGFGRSSGVMVSAGDPDIAAGRALRPRPTNQSGPENFPCPLGFRLRAKRAMTAAPNHGPPSGAITLSPTAPLPDDFFLPASHLPAGHSIINEP